MLRAVALLGACLVRRAGAERCDCACCHVTGRPPSLQVNGVDTMCSTGRAIVGGASLDSAPACPEQCETSPSESLVTTSEDFVLDQGRFCLLHCRPPTGAAMGTECVDITPAQLAELKTSGGNAADWASVAPSEAPDDEVEAPERSDADAIDEAAAQSTPAPNATLTAESEEVDASVADAKGKHALAAGLESRLAEAEAKSMRLLSASSAALRAAKKGAAVADSSSAMVLSLEAQAAVYARSAAKAASSARAELQEIRAAARTAAIEAAHAAAAQMEREADATEAEAAAMKKRFAPKKIEPFAEASVRAMQPYMKAMNRALASRMQYMTKAQELINLAAGQQRNAGIISKQAQIYQNGGNTKLAEQMMATARGLLDEASGSEAEAHKYQAVAAQITETLPSYQVTGAMASARAAALANPAGQPPPPVPLLVQTRAAAGGPGAEGARGPRR